MGLGQQPLEDVIVYSLQNVSNLLSFGHQLVKVLAQAEHLFDVAREAFALLLRTSPKALLSTELAYLRAPKKWITRCLKAVQVTNSGSWLLNQRLVTSFR